MITSDDAHAWVEVYFDGLGWVPFDPTPLGVDRAVDLPWSPRVGGAARRGPTPARGAEPTAPADGRPDDPAGGPAPTPTRGGGGSGPWGTVAIVAGAGAAGRSH